MGQLRGYLMVFLVFLTVFRDLAVYLIFCANVTGLLDVFLINMNGFLILLV